MRTFMDNIQKCTNTKKLKPGRIKYGVICNKDGGIIDDCVTLRENETDFLIIPNASNTDLVLNWFNQILVSDKYRTSIDTLKWTNIQIENITAKTAMIAIQGPESENKLSNILQTDLSKIKYFGSIKIKFQNKQVGARWWVTLTIPLSRNHKKHFSFFSHFQLTTFSIRTHFFIIPKSCIF